MAITVQEAQVIFSSDGLTQVKSQAGVAGRALDKTTSSAGLLIGKLRSVGSALSGVGGMLAGLGAGAAATWMAKLAAGAEQTSIAFEVLLGSASASKQMVDAMRALDMKTVFGFRELSDAAKMMLNYGVAGNDVVPMLEVISDIASGDAMKLEGLTRAFGQMSATGRLMGQDLNQMINAGFNPLKEISDKTGISMAELKKKMEAGQISTAMVTSAFRSATAEGGRFYGMNDRMSQTTAGQFAKLKSNIELVAIEIGTVLLPEANKLIEAMSKLVVNTDGVGDSFGGMVTKAKEWFQYIQDNIADMGVVMGTVAGHISTVWAGLWADLKSHAQAFFEWMTTNAGVVAANVATGVENAMLAVQGKQTRPFQSFAEFKAPELTQRERNPLWQQIQEQLAIARQVRQEGRNKAKQDAEGKKKGIDETVNNAKRGGKDEKGMFDGLGSSESQSAKSQTFSAEALFGSLRQGALDKQLGLMNEGLNLQQQQLNAANVIAQNVKNLNLGLA